MRSKFKYCEYFVKALFYLLLIGFFLNFYFIKQWEEFRENSTSLFSHFEDRKPLPNLILCVRPKVKHMPEYNITPTTGNSIFYNLIPNSYVYNFSMWQMYEEVTYNIGKDFDMFHNGKPIVGANVQKIPTAAKGMCIMMNSSIDIEKHVLEIYVKNEAIKKFELIFTGINNWQEIVYSRWIEPLNSKELIEIVPRFSRNFGFMLKPRVVQRLEGILNREACIVETLNQSNCTTICSPILFDFLDIPKCSIVSDYLCMAKFFLGKKSRGLIWPKCFENQNFVLYKQQNEGRLTAFQNDTYVAKFIIQINHIPKRVEVLTERYVISTTDFIGSVGGSLGLFLGFSIFTYSSDLVSKIFKYFNQ